MCIKNHTHCSVESVTEAGTVPPLSSECEQVDGLCRDLKHLTCLTRESEDRGTPFRDDLKTCYRETSIVQHIIYNTNRVVWSPLVMRKLLRNTHPGAPLPLPRPPKKKHPQVTQKRLLIKSPSPVCFPRNRFP
jgi:hypothetical protein